MMAISSGKPTELEAASAAVLRQVCVGVGSVLSDYVCECVSVSVWRPVEVV